MSNLEIQTSVVLDPTCAREHIETESWAVNYHQRTFVRTIASCAMCGGCVDTGLVEPGEPMSLGSSEYLAAAKKAFCQPGERHDGVVETPVSLPSQPSA